MGALHDHAIRRHHAAEQVRACLGDDTPRCVRAILFGDRYLRAHEHTPRLDETRPPARIPYVMIGGFIAVPSVRGGYVVHHRDGRIETIRVRT